MKKEKIKALLIEPMKHPCVVFIEPSIKAFQKAVNQGAIVTGEVEAKKLEKRVYAVFNKDRFLSGLDANRKIDDDILVGAFYVIATNEKYHPKSLTDEQTTKYCLRFWEIEEYDDGDVAEANLRTICNAFWQDEDLQDTNIYY